MPENKVTLRFEPGQAWYCEACRAQGTADTEGIVIHLCPQTHPAVYPHKAPNQSSQGMQLGEGLGKVFNTSPFSFPKPKAKRNLTRPRYDLIPKEWLDCLASIFEEGATKYGERNWQNGDKQFALDCLNHAQDHLLNFHAFQRGTTGEDDLGKVAWNALAARTLLRDEHGQ